MPVSKRRASCASDFSPSPPPPPRSKKTKPAGAIADFSAILTTRDPDDDVARLPARAHAISYHKPLLLSRAQDVASLLEWFERVSDSRAMPWRSPFLDPAHHDADELREAQKKRAYQVWISEIMLQQTRVETVKSYWLAWMAKWPSIDLLAAAPEEEVLAAWRGLGYYSRATRIHTAAKQVVADPELHGVLPQTPPELEKVPGIGAYTAGAISSIVYGRAVPILDGNVARVLSRQLGLYANPKAKATTDVLWEAARVVVEKAQEVKQGGATPGQWNQALMELGSTLCTPLKPACNECPIRASCRAHAEATLPASKGGVEDIEDLCKLCEPFPNDLKPEPAAKSEPKGGKKMRQATLSFGTSSSTEAKETARVSGDEAVHAHVCKFPMKLSKKTIRTESCLVCIVRRPAGEYLLEQRPASGLLASMWQFPSLTLSTTEAGSTATPPTPPTRAQIDEFATSLLGSKAAAQAHQRIGTIEHVFSHLHLTMHVYCVELAKDVDLPAAKRKKEEAKARNFGSSLGDTATRKWADAAEVEAETMGTGMRNCWIAYQQQATTPARAKTKPAKRKS